MTFHIRSITTGLIGLALIASSSFAATTPKKGEISMDRAKEIALSKVDGSITSSEYEHERGQDVYSFDIAGKDGRTHEVLISARSGKIVSSTIESAAKEAAEQKADKMNATH